LLFDEAAEDVINDYRVNRKRSLAVVERRIKKCGFRPIVNANSGRT
jgi:hypothetical protein